MANYGEIFCTAVNEIVQQQIAGLNYDITKDCTITSIHNKSMGEYMVSDGSSSFKAYAQEGATYAVGDKVLVTIPQGNYNNQKTILSLIVDNVNSVGYRSPLDDFIKGSGNIISVQGPQSIQVNSNTSMTKLYTLDKSSNLLYGFTHVAVTAEFMASLSEFDLTSGEYGLKLLIYGGSSDSNLIELTWKSSDMLGNPFAFDTYFYQEVVFAIPQSLKHITKLELWLYQDQQFKPIDQSARISVRNINAWLGFASAAGVEEVVKISTDDASFGSSNILTRRVDLQWIHVKESGVFEPINAFTWDNYKNHCQIRWYQYEPGCAEGDTDEYGGKNWRWLNQTVDIDNIYDEYPFSYDVVLNAAKETEKIKAIAFYTSNPLENNTSYEVTTNYESNILEFENSSDTNTGGTATKEVIESELSLYFEDDSCGNYYWYDQNGLLIDSSNEGSSKDRKLSLYARNAPVEDWEYYNNIEWIKWEVPNDQNKSMIIAKESDDDKFTIPTDDLLAEKNKFEPIDHTDTGTFVFNGVCENDSVNKVKIRLCTSNKENDDKGNDWDIAGNRPYEYTWSLTKGSEIKTQFSITRMHKRIKIECIYYDKDDNEISVDNGVTGITLKPQTNFKVKTRNKENNSLIYAIQNSWLRSRDNNTIICTVSVNGIIYTITENLRFGTKGSSGTANTFILEMLDNKNSIKPGGELRVQAILIGGNNKRIMFTDEMANKIDWSIIHPGYISQSTKNNDIITLKCSSKTVPENNYTILQAKYKYPVADAESKTTPYLYAFLPIPISADNCLGMQGPTQVIYNHQGVPKYSSNPYIAFYETSTGEVKEWYLTQPTGNPNEVSLVMQNGYQTLKAPTLYTTIQNKSDIIQDCVCVYCKKNGTTIWSQPILIMQSQYDFAMLNSWDGSLTIDEENGTILATMIGAGKKNSDNQFSGVLMGDIQGGTGLNDTDPLTGVYGFDDGVMSYALREDGTGFFGAKKNGRIEFNGEHGAIHSYGWTPAYQNDTTSGDKWTQWSLSSEVTSGSVFDLDDGQLQLYANDSNYFKYNDNNSGKIEMALSGADIKLNDKTNNPGLSAYIDITAKGIVTEFRRTAAYYATCNTESSWTKTINEKDGTVTWSQTKDNGIKELSLTNFSSGYHTDENTGVTDETKDIKIDSLSINDICKNGITIAVTFTSAELVKETITKTEASNPRKSEEKHYTGSSISYEGNALFLFIKDDSTTLKKPIKINGANTSSSNYFSWAAGTTVYFTYYNDAWEVTDSGSYSQTVQTADTIYNEVSQIGGSLSSSIKQTAESIESEVRSYAGYYGVSKDAADDNNVYSVVLENAPDVNFNITSDLLKNGVGLAVKFHKKQDTFITGNSGIKIKITDGSKDESNKFVYTDAKPIIVENGNKFSWTEYSTIYFVYTESGWQVTDAGNYSRITQTADAIVAEVKRKAQYYGTCETADGVVFNEDGTFKEFNTTNAIKKVALQNLLKSDPVNNIKETPINATDLYQTGVTIAVTFTDKQSIIQNKAEQKNTSNKVDEDISYEYNDITYTTTGQGLSLYVFNLDTTDNSALPEYPIFIQKNQTTQGNKDNTFGWATGSTIYFTFNSEIGNGDNKGGWLVSDSGSYSKITQTADMIKAEIETLDGKYGSAITQTAKQIRLEVNQKANYTATCDTAADVTTKELVIKDVAKLDAILDNTNEEVDCIILVYFTYANTAAMSDTNPLKFKFVTQVVNGLAQEYSFTVNGNPKWEAGETLPFRLNRPANGTGSFTLTSLSNSKITELANSITSYVDRKGGYACSGTWDSTNEYWKLDILAKNDQGIALTWDQIKTHQDSHKVIAVTFTEAQSGKEEIKLYSNTAESVYLGGNITSNTNPLNWDKNATLYFAYDGGKWRVVDSGAYSKIKETADSITATVANGLQYVGVSTTDSDSITKDVVVDTTFTLQHGVTIAVTFVNNTGGDASFPRNLNVASTGAKPIYKKTETGWARGLDTRAAGSLVAFIYDANQDTNGIKGAWKETKNGAYSRIQQNADNISAKVSNTHKDTSFGWNLKDTGFYMVNNGNDASDSNYIFACDSSGLKIKGEIVASSGNIGYQNKDNPGWKIENNRIVKYGSGAGWAGSSASNNFDRDGSFLLQASGASPSMYFAGSGSKTDWRLVIGQYFGVDSKGQLYCSKGSFGGSLSAATGTFKYLESSNGAESYIDIGSTRLQTLGSAYLYLLSANNTSYRASLACDDISALGTVYIDGDCEVSGDITGDSIDVGTLKIDGSKIDFSSYLKKSTGETYRGMTLRLVNPADGKDASYVTLYFENGQLYQYKFF